MLAPYIGITDFTDFQQVKRMLEIFNAHKKLGSNRRLHVGVMTGFKQLKNIPHQFKAVWPPNEKIAPIFGSDDAYNCLHYVDYRGQPKLWENLADAIALGGVGINAIQLDMTWPDPGQIANGLHASRRNIEVILQIGRRAFEQVENNQFRLCEKLEDYEGIIHRVLLDKSMGEGKGMDAHSLMSFIHEIKKSFPDMGIGIAGGLGPRTMHLPEPILMNWSNISMDAQLQLHEDADMFKPVDWNAAGEYLVESLKRTI